MYKDNIDKTTLINEYNPSNIIISDFIAHPHAIPNSAKNNAPITDSFNILFSSFIIYVFNPLELEWDYLELIDYLKAGFIITLPIIYLLIELIYKIINL